MAFLLASVILIALVGGLYMVSFWASATNRTIEKLSAYEWIVLSLSFSFLLEPQAKGAGWSAGLTTSVTICESWHTSDTLDSPLSHFGPLVDDKLFVLNHSID
jgi:hypothetical protein